MSAVHVTSVQDTREAHRAAVGRSVADNATFDTAYVVMNILATVVACYGLLANSPAVVIGAMIIAMLLGPISGVGLALVNGDDRLLGRALVALLGGLLVVLATAFCIGLVHYDIPATAEMMARTSPNLLDLMIALGGGAAGAFAVASPRLSVAFVGVAIATALVPPLATCSMLLARGELSLAGGAFLLALTNIVAIQFASSVVFLLSGFHKVGPSASFALRPLLRNLMSVFALLLLGAVLAGNLKVAVDKTVYEDSIRKSLKVDLAKFPGANLDGIRVSESGRTALIRALVRGPLPFTAADVAILQQHLHPSPGGRLPQLRISYVHTDVMSAEGLVFEKDDPVLDKKPVNK